MSDHTVPPAIAKIAPDGNLTPRQMHSEDLESLIFLGQKELKPPSEEE